MTLLVLAGFVLPGLSGCSVAPVQEMSNARQALAAAEQAGAGEYAAESLQRARYLLDSAEEKLARHLFEQARKDANSAKAEALLAKRITEVARKRSEDGD